MHANHKNTSNTKDLGPLEGARPLIERAIIAVRRRYAVAGIGVLSAAVLLPWALSAQWPLTPLQVAICVVAVVLVGLWIARQAGRRVRARFRRELEVWAQSRGLTPPALAASAARSRHHTPWLASLFTEEELLAAPTGDHRTPQRSHEGPRNEA